MAYIIRNNSLTLLILLLFLTFIGLNNCANPVSLRGGPRDLVAPKIIGEKSTENFQTQFTMQDIVLEFDEFINLRDAFNQIIISPPTEVKPEVEARGKRVTLQFDENEVLRENATYSIFFGNSIQDFTEGNVLENFKFVFSTGDKIDSLILTGTVTNAITGQNEVGVLVMLYEDVRDSIVYEQRPFYFSKSDKNGNYKLENLKPGSFKIFALKDANLNYLYDLENEPIGFIDTLLTISDSIPNMLDLEVFQAKTKLLINDQEIRYGLARFELNQSSENINVRLLNTDPLFEYRELREDSVLLWFDVVQDSSLQILIEDDLDFSDTILPRRLNKSQVLENLSLRGISTNLWRGALKPGDAFEVKFNNPLVTIDTSKIIFLDSISISPRIEIDSIHLRTLSIQPFSTGSDTFNIQLLPGAVKDYLDKSHDTLQYRFSYLSEENLSKILLDFTDLSPDYDYRIELRKGKEILQNDLISGLTTASITYEDLLPDKYELFVIEDINRNGKWDTGDYQTKRQPEKQASQKLEQLRENWELELTLSAKTLFSDN